MQLSPPPHHIKPFQLLISCLVLAIGIWVFVTTTIGIVQTYTPIYWGDLWGFPTLVFDTYHGWDNILSLLSHQHNEHRLGALIAFCMVDYYCFGCLQIFLYSSLFALASIQTVLFGFLSKRIESRKGLLIGLWGMSLMLFFSASPAENLFAPTGIAFLGLFVCVTIAFYSFSKAITLNENSNQTSVSTPWMLLSFAFTFLSVNHLASGIFIFPTLLLASILMRLPWKWIIGQLLVYVSIAVLYFYNYNVLGTSHFEFTRIPEYFNYLAHFLGNAYYNQNSQHWSQTMGWIGILSSALSLLLFALHTRKRKLQILPIFCGIAFLIICGLVVAYGRSHMGFEQAYSPRYISFSLFFWACIVLFYYHVLSHAGKIVKITGIPVLSTVLIVLTFNIVLKQNSSIRWRIDEGNERSIMAIGLATEVIDEEHFKPLFPFPKRYRNGLLKEILILKERNLSIYSLPETQELNNPLTGFQEMESAEAHTISEFQSQPLVSYFDNHSGFKFEGYLNEASINQPIDRLVILSKDKRLLGYAKLDVEKQSSVRNLLPESIPNHRAFMGFARFDETPNNPVYLYGINTSENLLIQLQKISDFFQSGYIDVSDVKDSIEGFGAPVTDIAVKIEGTWKENGHYSDPGIAAQTLFSTYGSWVGNDANTGTIETSITVPIKPNQLLYVTIPVLHGPGASIGSISFTQQGETQLIPLNNPPQTWHFYRVSLATPVEVEAKTVTFTLEASDSGSGWGQWMAIGIPFVSNYNY